MFEDLKKRLEDKGYQVSVFENKEAAADYLDGQIDDRTVGLGGSVTIHQMDLFAKLAGHNVVYWHDEKPADMTVMETRMAATRSEVYISGVNGISEAGDIVNIDNIGNRVAAVTYGPSKIYLLVGANKIAPTLEAAVYRARNIAAPLNAQRLNRKTPCAVKGDKCYDCNSPDRICRSLSILLSKPPASDYEIILINEELGL